jgi:hypothetical protein
LTLFVQTVWNRPNLHRLIEVPRSVRYPVADRFG